MRRGSGHSATAMTRQAADPLYVKTTPKVGIDGQYSDAPFAAIKWPRVDKGRQKNKG
jgi:hypothetical protein